MDEIRVLRGTPNEEELAALVAVLLGRRSTPTGTAAPVSRWARSARPLAVLRGPDAWRASTLPR